MRRRQTGSRLTGIVLGMNVRRQHKTRNNDVWRHLTRRLGTRHAAFCRPSAISSSTQTMRLTHHPCINCKGDVDACENQ